MADDFIAGFRTGSENQIQNAGRHSRRFKNFHDADCSARSYRRGFENNRVAGDHRVTIRFPWHSCLIVMRGDRCGVLRRAQFHRLRDSLVDAD